ncbi:uncharacterized protein BcabD6B2_50990 [Babesia caballi]|uniref:Uncharacterized protein n=1 Tax=Babesia caballi TaxID=5871 RepID=A0AAV4LZY4_BABCB|nr:hypothetical protein BcabD6B2_50990 [Babesia caballi]
MEDVALPDALNRAYIVAAAGLFWTCSGLSANINTWYREKLPENLSDAELELLVMATQAYRVLGVTAHLTRTLPTVMHVESELKNKTLIRSINYQDVLKKIENVMHIVRSQAEAVEQLCEDSDSNCTTSAPISKSNWYFYVEFPKIWLGPLQMIYNALKLNNPKVLPAKLFVTRLQQFGTLQFYNTRHTDVVKAIGTTFYMELFKKSAMSVVEDLFDSILGAVDNEQRALLQPLFDLYYLSLDFKNIA